MDYFLGVDGGGTGCRLRLARASGEVIAEASGGAANIATDAQAALRHLRAACDALLAEAGLSPEVLPRITAGLGLAGVNVSDAAGFGAQLPFGRHQLVTDGYTSTLGALGGADGIVAAIGTGSVFAAMRDGAYRQIGGWGFHLGDEGSGAVLGRMRLSAALQAEDGLLPLTAFCARTLTEAGGAAALPGFARDARPADYARLAPAVFEAAAEGDPVAAQILQQAGAPVTALIRHLQAGAPLPVVWTGGLGPLWAEQIGGSWARRAPAGTALDGAMALAFAQKDA